MAERRLRWQELPGRNKFCCGGRLMCSRQTGVFYFTLVLILGTMALFFYSDAPFLWTRVSPALPLLAAVFLYLVLANLLRTAFSDPGVIPRASAAEAAAIEAEINAELANGEGGAAAPSVNGYRPPPRMREVDIRGQPVKLKYCFTCRLFRPPRSSHCSICDNCIANFDHHCPWVGNCVGARNYRHFYLFTATLSLLCLFVFACVVGHVVLLAQDGSFLDAVKASPGSLVVALICFFSIWSVLGLAGFHSYLLASAQTTNEDIKGTFSPKRNPDSSNPYSFGGLAANCAAVLCGPVLPSTLRRREPVDDGDPLAGYSLPPPGSFPPARAEQVSEVAAAAKSPPSRLPPLSSARES